MALLCCFHLYDVLSYLNFIHITHFAISVPVHTLEVNVGGREHSQKTPLSTRLLSTTGSIPAAPTKLTESR